MYSSRLVNFKEIKTSYKVYTLKYCKEMITIIWNDNNIVIICRYDKTITSTINLIKALN